MLLQPTEKQKLYILFALSHSFLDRGCAIQRTSNKTLEIVVFEILNINIVNNKKERMTEHDYYIESFYLWVEFNGYKFQLLILSHNINLRYRSSGTKVILIILH